MLKSKLFSLHLAMITTSVYANWDEISSEEDYSTSYAEEDYSTSYAEEDCPTSYAEEDCPTSYAEEDCPKSYAEEDCSMCYEECVEPVSFGVGGSWAYLRLLSFPNSFARIVETPTSTDLNSYVDLREVFLDTKYSSGFNLFAFYRSPPSCENFSWEILCDFTAYHYDENSLVTLPQGSLKKLQPSTGFIYFNTQEKEGFYYRANATFKTDFDSVRGLMGRCLSRNGIPVVRVFWGVEYVDIKESFEVLYDDYKIELFLYDAYEPVGELDFFSNTRQLSRFSGIGPTLGFSGRLPFLCNVFSFFGESSVSTLISKKTGLHDQETLNQSEVNGVDRVQNLKTKNTFCPVRALTPALNAEVGIKLNVNYSNSFALEISASYKGLYYWDALTEILNTTMGEESSKGLAQTFRNGKSTIKSRDYALGGWVIGGSFQF